MATQAQKDAAKAKRLLKKQMELGEQLADILFHEAVTEAYEINAALRQALLSHKEVCAQRRASAYEVTSIFTNSINEGSSCYNIELLLTEFHTENQLVKLMNTPEMLAKCGTLQVKRSRIRSHISHLRKKFTNTARYVEKLDGFKVVFKFELK